MRTPKEISDYKKEYRKKNPEKFKAYEKHRYALNIEKEKLRHKKRYKENIEKEKIRAKIWRDSNKEKKKEMNKKWLKTPNGKISRAKTHARRDRELGFNPLNNYFENSNAHHLDKINIIHIPNKLHKSYQHSQKDNKSMKQINIKAWDFMENQSY